MGAYSADGIVSTELEQQILQTVVRPTFEGFAKDGERYRGFLYFGLMLTPAGPKVLEFNCRLGDPETQPIVARMDFDLADVLSAANDGGLNEININWKPGASLCVVMASGGYPGKYASGAEIHGLDEAATMRDVTVFHAGTGRERNNYYTSSGRVLGVTASGTDLADARRKAYSAVKAIHFQDAHYRTDIGGTAEQLKAAGRQ
jgi:phosphoribosylamine--glycine ligase